MPSSFSAARANEKPQAISPFCPVSSAGPNGSGKRGECSVAAKAKGSCPRSLELGEKQGSAVELAGILGTIASCEGPAAIGSEA